MVISNKCCRKVKEVSGKTLKETKKKKKGHQGYPCLSLFISDFTILKV